MCAECLNYINATPQLPQRCRFFRGRVKTSKNNTQVYRWPKKRSLCCGFILVLFFRKSTKRWPRLDFWGVKNASKSDENYELWRAPRTIRRLGSSARTDPKNRAKMTENASKSNLKWTRKNVTSGFAMVKNARRRRLMKMHRNAVIFVVPAFALLTSWMQKSFKNVKNSQKMITKNTKPDFAMVKHARRRPTCENA